MRVFLIVVALFATLLTASTTLATNTPAEQGHDRLPRRCSVRVELPLVVVVGESVAVRLVDRIDHD